MPQQAHLTTHDFSFEVAPIVICQLSRRSRDNFLAVVGPLPGKHLCASALSDVPVHQQSRIHRCCRCLARLLDKLPQVSQQLGCIRHGHGGGTFFFGSLVSLMRTPWLCTMPLMFFRALSVASWACGVATHSELFASNLIAACA